jgi:Recombination endonuclease VII
MASSQLHCVMSNQKYDHASVQPGVRFGRGVVTGLIRVPRERPGKRPVQIRHAVLLCDCGSVYRKTLTHLLRGDVVSCGCLQRERSSAHMQQLNAEMNAQRLAVGPETPCASEHRQAMRVQRFDTSDPMYNRRWYLWLRHHITLEFYNELLAVQEGRCAICRRLPGEAGHKADVPLHVDHDHACCPTTRESCGRCVRGLLCNTCNRSLGWLEHLGASAYAYLEAYEGREVVYCGLSEFSGG